MVDSTRWAFATGAAPLALPTGETSTIVLLAREEPYTLQELADLVPDAVQQESEGSYLISSHLVIDRGATLRIHDDSGLRSEERRVGKEGRSRGSACDWREEGNREG